MRNSEKSCQIHMAGEQSGQQKWSKKVVSWKQGQNPKGFKCLTLTYSFIWNTWSLLFTWNTWKAIQQEDMNRQTAKNIRRGVT